MSAIVVYITAGSREEARAIGKVLVEERLAACVNILGEIESMYWWEGEAQRDQEISLIAKTRSDLFAQLNQRVAEVHSYDCPCIVSLPISDVNPPFLQWIEEQTR
ncbi:divalent-cation tolerance protein CutA [Desulfurispira natronophila]|uniref:Periplasmic divalent cation tolerance protein n=1 Tax=Desulfurispira natronophila TaxID=682562 RepID=A0A7W7Y328_9BACT|nr:divalent-cation tolerance protein CutA [Desulfurispira natronophila]MBB5021124.1 periplasmic divalent cation tolerance protein [Desulfurispira natronophila]